MTTPALPAAVPEIPVTHIDEAVAYYVRRLGFAHDWGGDEMGLAGISSGGCRLFLADAKHRTAYGNAGPVLTWLNLDSTEEVDALYHLSADRGVTLLSAPESKPWGLHEFTAADPDGNLLRVFHDFATPRRTADA